MSYLQSLLLVLAITLLDSVLGNKICDFSKVECATTAAQNVYKSIIPGIQGLTKSCDPLYLEEVKYELPSLSYQLSNVTMSGMRNCQVLQLIFNKEESTYHYDLLCPELVLNYGYKCKGFLGSTEVEGKGSVTAVFNDYLINIKGQYGEFISEKARKLHFFLKSSFIEFEPKGNITIDVKGFLHSDKEKSELAKAYVQENLSEMEKILRSPTIKSYITMFLDNADKYWRATPVEEIFSMED